MLCELAANAAQPDHDTRQHQSQRAQAENSRGADVVVDAVGSLLGTAIKCVRRGGKVLLFGMDERAVTKVQQNTITRKEIQISGTYISHFTFPSAIKLIESHVLPLDKLITHELTLEDLPEGIELMKSGEALEIIVKP